MISNKLKQVRLTLCFLKSVIECGDPISNEIKEAVRLSFKNLDEADDDYHNTECKLTALLQGLQARNITKLISIADPDGFKEYGIAYVKAVKDLARKHPKTNQERKIIKDFLEHYEDEAGYLNDEPDVLINNYFNDRDNDND